MQNFRLHCKEPCRDLQAPHILGYHRRGHASSVGWPAAISPETAPYWWRRQPGWRFAGGVLNATRREARSVVVVCRVVWPRAVTPPRKDNHTRRIFLAQEKKLNDDRSLFVFCGPCSKFPSTPLVPRERGFYPREPAMKSGASPPPEVTSTIPNTGDTTTGEVSSLLVHPPPPPTLTELPPSAEMASPSSRSDPPPPPVARSPTVLATAIQRVDSLTVEAVAAVSTAVRPIHSPAESTESLGEALAGTPHPRSRRDEKVGSVLLSRTSLVGRLPVVGERMSPEAAVPIEGSTAATNDGNEEKHPPPVASSSPPTDSKPALGDAAHQRSTGGEDAAAADEELVAAIAEMKASPLAARTADALVNAVRRVDSMTPATAEEVAAALDQRPRVPQAEGSANRVGDAPPSSANGTPDGDPAAGNVSARGSNGCAGVSGGGRRLPPKPPSDSRPGHRRGDTLVNAIAAADDATLRAAAAVADAVVRVDTEDEGLDVGASAVAYPS